MLVAGIMFCGCTGEVPRRARPTAASATETTAPENVGRRRGFPEGSARIADRKRVAPTGTYSLADLSPDATVAAAYRLGPASEKVAAFGLFDMAKATFRSLGRAESSGLRFSADGSRILFRLGEELRSVRTSSGRVSLVARQVNGKGPYGWLRDGRVFYLDTRRHVMIVEPGEAPSDTEIRLHDPPPSPVGEDWAAHDFAVSPDGDRILYAEHCGVSLIEVKADIRKRIAWGFNVAASAWSPDGRFFVLHEVTWDPGCATGDGPPTYDVLFDREGRRVGEITGEDDALSHGHSLTWSPDGRWLLIGVQPTGSAVAGYQYLRVVSMAERRITTVVPDRLDAVFAGPNDRLVFSLLNRADAADIGDYSGSIFVGRLIREPG